MSTEKEVKRRVEGLSLGPDDLLIVHDEEDMKTLIDMTQKGIGFSKYSNPVLYIQGGITKATEQDLVDALRIMMKQKKKREPLIIRAN